MYTKEQARESIFNIGYKIHHFSERQDGELEALIGEVHRYIYNSDISYIECFSAVKKIASSDEHFNEYMNLIRNTLWRRKQEKGIDMKGNKC